MNCNANISIVGMPADIKPPEDLQKILKFLPPMNPIQYQNLLYESDIFWSPNRGWRDNGMFDGFPTGAAVQAGASGCFLLTSDALGENRYTGLEQGSYELCSFDATEYAEKTKKIIEDRNFLLQKQMHSINSFQKTYSSKSQMIPRFDMIEKILKSL